MEDKKPGQRGSVEENSEKRQSAKENVRMLRLTDLHPFPNHPFKVREDESMKETAKSIGDVGVLTPAIVRPRKEAMSFS